MMITFFIPFLLISSTAKVSPINGAFGIWITALPTNITDRGMPMAIPMQECVNLFEQKIALWKK
jgi:hypothetical protein